MEETHGMKADGELIDGKQEIDGLENERKSYYHEWKMIFLKLLTSANYKTLLRFKGILL